MNYPSFKANGISENFNLIFFTLQEILPVRCFIMTEQEYRTIRDMAWLILINSKTNSLPIDIGKIANLYDFSFLIDSKKSRYENCLNVCREILRLYGINYQDDFPKYFTVRVMSPAIVLREIKVSSPKELAIITDLPMNLAEQRFTRLQQLLKRDKFETSNMESIVLSQFKDWIDKHHAQP